MVHKGNGVQVIYGPRVTVIKANLEEYLEYAPDEEYVPETETSPEAHTPAAEKTSGTGTDSAGISRPVNGTAADLSETPDEAFAGRMMGDGAMVLPSQPEVYAPEDGEVCFVFETKHAIGFQTDSGIAMLLHMGIDTVNLNGEGFEVLVQGGTKVKKGDLLMRLDLEYLKAHAPSLASPVLCTELGENQKIRLLAGGEVKAGDPLFAVDTYQ